MSQRVLISHRFQRSSKLLERFPAEVLLYIFDFATDDFDPRRQEPTIDVGDSPWSTTLRMKKAIVCVCKKWRTVAIPDLYRRVYLHRIGQLCALVKMLKEYSGAGYSSWVHHVHGQFYVHPSWEAVYFKSVVRLLSLCPSIRTFSWKIAWGGHRRCLWGGAGADPLSPRNPLISLMLLTRPSLQPTLNSLRKLTFTLDRRTEQVILIENSVDPMLTFTNLEDLMCEATEPDLLEGFNFVSDSFIIPKLQHLTIQIPLMPRDHLSDVEVGFIFKILESHGEKLTSLALDLLSVVVKTSRSVGNILQYTPNLRSLRCSSLTFTPIDAATSIPTAAPFTKLEKLEIFTLASRIEPNPPPEAASINDLEQFLIMASSRKKFPSLQTIAILGQNFPSIPLDGLVIPSRHAEVFAYLLAWSNKYLAMGGIALVGADDEPIAPADPTPERWTGRNTSEDQVEEGEDVHTDPEDLSFDSDGIVFKDESSDYSSSDSECDDGDWETESSVSVVSSTEAQEIFENTLEVCLFLFRQYTEDSH